LCSGVRLDACELKACEQMKDIIRIQLAEGQDLETIRTYFVGQYGPQVLGAPPTSGFNLLAWVLPVVVLLGGGLYIVLRMRAGRSAAPIAVAHSTPSPAEGEYARKLDEELRKYE
jgi:cytochrome c-type biogenesis protein CcmH